MVRSVSIIMQNLNQSPFMFVLVRPIERNGMIVKISTKLSMENRKFFINFAVNSRSR